MSCDNALTAAFPVLWAGRHPHCHFRGLLRLHLRYGTHARSTAHGGFCVAASTEPVTRPRRPSATSSIDNSLGEPSSTGVSRVRGAPEKADIRSLSYPVLSLPQRHVRRILKNGKAGAMTDSSVASLDHDPSCYAGPDRAGLLARRLEEALRLAPLRRQSTHDRQRDGRESDKGPSVLFKPR